MGNLLHRPTRKEKRKQQHQQFDKLYEHDGFATYDENNNENVSEDFTMIYSSWEKEFNQQKIINRNDPPGAPITNPSNFSINQNHPLTQSWSANHNINNPFYPMNSIQMTPSFNIPYDPNQYNQSLFSNNRSEIIRPEKQFSSVQKTTSISKPLTNTQSWRGTNDTPVRLSNKSSLSQAIQVPVDKPIYVGIDYGATLAERNQTTTKRHHRKINNSEKQHHHSDSVNSSPKDPQIRSHTSRQHIHQTSVDSSKEFNVNTISNKSFDSFQPKSSNSQRIIMKKSLSANRLSQNIEQLPIVRNEIKPAQTRNSREKQRRRQHVSNGTQSLTRRSENRQSNTPVMRIHISQLNQPMTQSMTTGTTRTRM